MRPQLASLLVLAVACAGANDTAGTESAASAQVAAAEPVTSATAGDAAAPLTPNAADPRLTATVYKDPSCGCCSKWVDHLRDAGFTVTARDVSDLTEIKRRHSVPQSLYACHTAEVGDYVVEGHVPADVIQKMLQERPEIAGIAVGGMPAGSPGMEGPFSEPYEVVAFTRSGSTSVYARR